MNFSNSTTVFIFELFLTNSKIKVSMTAEEFHAIPAAKAADTNGVF